MNQLNQIIIEGNLVREPETRTTAGGKSLATFTIASNRYIRRADGEFEQEVSYFDCEAWGKDAETTAKKAAKGTGCRVIGRLKQDRWKGGDGRAYSRVRIVSEHLEFLPGNGTEGKPAAETEGKQGGKSSRPLSRSELFQPHGSQGKGGQPSQKAAGFDIF